MPRYHVVLKDGKDKEFAVSMPFEAPSPEEASQLAIKHMEDKFNDPTKVTKQWATLPFTVIKVKETNK